MQQDLVPPEMKTNDWVSIRCAHGEVVLYVLADVSKRI